VAYKGINKIIQHKLINGKNHIILNVCTGVSGWMVRPPDVPGGRNCLGNLFRLLANKQTNELRIKKYIHMYTHIAEMNIFIDNTL
jgi:hypothetical protein